MTRNNSVFQLTVWVWQPASVSPGRPLKYRNLPDCQQQAAFYA